MRPSAYAPWGTRWSSAGPVHVVTTKRATPAVELITRPPSLAVILDDHRTRADTIAAPLPHLAYRAYARLAVGLVAAAYAIAWVIADPVRTAAATAVAVVLLAATALL